MAYKIDYALAPIGDVEADLGRRLEEVRLGRNMSQAQLAEEAGVSLRTITRLANGQGISLDTFLRVMRALGLVGRLADLLPDPSVRPIDRVRLKGHERKRARPATRPAAEEWTWADDSEGS